MASVTQTPRVTAAPGRTGRAAGRTLLFGKVLATIGIALFSSLALPWVLARAGRVVEDRQKERELKVAVSEGVIEALTSAVTRADLFASGLIRPGADTTATTGYASVLESWLAASSKAGAQLQTYLEGGDVPSAAVRSKWLPLFSSVTDYLRLSTDLEQLNRAVAAEHIHATLAGCFPAVGGRGLTGENRAEDVDWTVLGGATRATGFYAAFHAVGKQLLAARDSLVNDLRSARLTGFSRHLFEIRGSRQRPIPECGDPTGSNGGAR